MQESRTKWAERFVDWFAGIPLTAECVFYSPQYLDKRVQKEVCDFLIILRGEGILVSMKSQEDPSTRIGNKLARWTVKNAKEALTQAKGALGTLGREHFWCRHSRRGRVDFKPGSINVSQVIVLTELTGETVELPSDFPLSIRNIPVTYLSVNDFCNLLSELRTFNDLMAYLQSRRTLPNKSLRTVGDDKPFYEYYLLNKGFFAECCGYEDARITVAARHSDLKTVLAFKPLTDKFAGVIECVSDALAKRLDNYAEGLEPSTVALFDGSDSRSQYLLMQEELCYLSLFERQTLGMQLTRLVEKVGKSDKSQIMAYGACYLDSKADFVYVLISSKGVGRPTLIKRGSLLLRAGMAAYEKERGMVIADRDGKNFEIQMASGFSPGANDKKLAEKHFSHLKISDLQASYKL